MCNNVYLNLDLDLSGGDEFWLGFHDIQREGLFVWSDGSSGIIFSFKL